MLACSISGLNLASYWRCGLDQLDLPDVPDRGDKETERVSLAKDTTLGCHLDDCHALSVPQGIQTFLSAPDFLVDAIASAENLEPRLPITFC